MILSTYNAAITATVASAAMATKSVAVFMYVATQPPAIEAFAAYRQDVVAGETVVIEWNVKKTVDCIGSSMRVWEGEGGYQLREPIRPVTIPISRDWREYSIETEVPESAPNGWLRLSIDGVYDCPERRIPFSLGPVVFSVSGKKDVVE